MRFGNRQKRKFEYSAIFVSSCLLNNPDATEYIIDNIDVSKMKIYNHFNFGSYLELNGIKVFLDSINELKAFNEEDLDDLTVSQLDTFLEEGFTPSNTSQAIN